MTKLMPVVACAAALSASSLFAAKNWDIYADVRDGMTGAQQITNAMTQAEAGDVLRVHPGVYDFTGTYMSTETYTKGGVTYVVTNHVEYLKSVHIYGRTEANQNPGHWDDTVVFRGDGTGRCLLMDEYWGRDVRNITFENFSAGSYPDALNTDMHTKGNGGAIQCVRNNGAALAISNCVFRNCRAYNGGAVHGGGLTDCLLTNNVAIGAGGAASGLGAIRDCTFVDNSAKSVGALYMLGQDLMITNCVFVGNSSQTNGNVRLNGSGNRVVGCTFVGNHTDGKGGVICEGNSNVPFVDCVFSNNWAKLDGGAFCGASTGTFLTNCTFVGNYSKTGAGGAVSFGASAPVPDFHHCVFESNWATNGYGGAVYSAYGLTATDCTFTNNICYRGEGGAVWCSNSGAISRYGKIADSTFTGNYASSGTIRGCFLTNCTLVANSAVMRGGGLYYSYATDCVLKDNVKADRFGIGDGIHAEYGGGAAAFASLTDCDIESGSLWNCALLRCRIHGHKAAEDLGCVFYEGNWATNCLIDHCASGSRGFNYSYNGRCIPGSDKAGGEGAYVHCTFADNTFDSSAGFFSGKSSTEFRAHPAVYEGCVFANNKKNNGTEADISGRYITDAAKTKFRNCLYGADDGTFRDGSSGTWTDQGGNLAGVSPKFVAGSDAWPNAPYYMLRPTSPARGGGDVSLFTVDDVDLAGQPRITNDKLDLGCYQCDLKQLGLLIVVE